MSTLPDIVIYTLHKNETFQYVLHVSIIIVLSYWIFTIGTRSSVVCLLTWQNLVKRLFLFVHVHLIITCASVAEKIRSII